MFSELLSQKRRPSHYGFLFLFSLTAALLHRGKKQTCRTDVHNDMFTLTQRDGDRKHLTDVAADGWGESGVVQQRGRC
jgi:hypothetical protein